jgi:hypothetical protein
VNVAPAGLDAETARGTVWALNTSEICAPPVPRSLVAILLGFCSLPFSELNATASCAAPYFKTNHKLVLDRGTTVSVEGRAFVDGCQDTGSCTEQLGWTHCDYGEKEAPLNDVPLTLVQGERRWRLGEADAGKASDDQLGWVTWTFDTPGDARPGPARLVAPSASPMRVTLR